MAIIRLASTRLLSGAKLHFRLDCALKATYAIQSLVQLHYQGYLAAVLGAALASIFIGLIDSRVRLDNISLIYLLVVLWLAAAYGQGRPLRPQC